MKRLAVIALGFVALAVPVDANAALFFLFDQSSSVANDRVTVRTGGTPKSFEPKQRVKPFQRAERLYLVRTDVAARVRSRFDSRLSFVGSVVPDRNGRGLTTFSVPPLDQGTYTIAIWCPAAPLTAVGVRSSFSRPTSSSRVTARGRSCASTRSSRVRSLFRTGTSPRASHAACPGTATDCCGRASGPMASTRYRQTGLVRTVRLATSCSG
jgi:hypothetical protein